PTLRKLRRVLSSLKTEQPPAMKLYTIFTILVSLSAFFAYINYRFIRLPGSIGIMLLSLCCSLVLMVFGHWFPTFPAAVLRMISTLDFHELLMNIMLSFLLFGGAIRINATRLKKELLPVITLATFSTILSTVIVG